MKTVVIEVKPLADSFASMRNALRAGHPQRQARISFASYELMHRVLTPKRLGLIQALTGAGPMGVRELSRRVGRDVRAVHADAQALAKAGVIEKTEEGKLSFPYDAIHMDFVLKAA